MLFFCIMIDDIIDKELQFYTFDDFFKNRERIKQKYKTLNTKEVQIYKMYVYSNILELEKVKDYIWEWLNENGEEPYPMIFVEHRSRQRRKQRNRR